MRKVKTICSLLFLLAFSIKALSGVTDDGVTAYRAIGSDTFILFSDNPLDDPNSITAPLGAGRLLGGACRDGTGTAAISGLVCSGTAREPVANYSCRTSNVVSNHTNTIWCLFSENPRNSGKAWAVKFVNGDIPTNDGESIVRCEGTDLFHPYSGCGSSLPSAINIEEGYIKLDTTDGNVPFGGDCEETAHNGRMVFDDVSDKLYICTASGWKSTPLN